jgi:predicted DNA-binding transcriptional regulator YafY
MDTLIGILVLAAAIAAFIGMVRRTNAKGRELERQADSKPWLSDRPELLTKEQRKLVNPIGRQPRKRESGPRDAPLEPRPAKKATRAIRTGWSMGKVEFSYEDSAGDITYRTVTVHSITKTYLKGECHDRQAERTFRIDRIIGDLVDCETGEMMSPKQWIKENAL